jgi:biotin carboxylase
MVASGNNQPPVTIFFNRTYATIAEVIGQLRRNPDSRRIRVIASHVDPNSPVLAAADVALPEPASDTSDAIGDGSIDAYVDWALAICVEYRVDVFVPRLAMHAMAAARERFTAIGVAVLAAPPEAIALFDDKRATYIDAAARGLPVPPHLIVSDATQLLAAFSSIDAEFGSACLKPLTGVGGDGFRQLTDQPMSYADLVGPLSATLDVRTACAALQRATDDGRTPPPLMVMPFLPGPEISVDVLAEVDGKPLAAIGRVKRGRRRTLVDDHIARDIAETLVEAHSVSYLSNTQVRYWQGPGNTTPMPYLLECNTRISGGLFQTSLAGVNLLWSAIRLALGEEAEVGEIEYGIAYTTASSLLELTSGTAEAF